MEIKDFCKFIFELRDKHLGRREMADKYPWHLNTLKGYDKDRLCDVDYLYALAIETGFSFAELIKMRLSAGILADLVDYQVDDLEAISFELNGGKDEYNGSDGTEIIANDESMMPTIVPGATVTVDVTDKALQEGKIYAVELNKKIVPRRIQYGLGGALMLVSDNPRFAAITVEQNKISSLTILGKVTSSLNPL